MIFCCVQQRLSLAGMAIPAVVKYVIATKQNENAVALSENQKAAEKQRLMGLLSRKKDEELEGKSAEENQPMAKHWLYNCYSLY